MSAGFEAGDGVTRDANAFGELLDRQRGQNSRGGDLSAFDLKKWNSPDWEDQTIAFLDSSFRQGAVGIKIWKNIGMVYRDSAGQFIMIDNPRFDRVIDFVISKDKTVMGHLGEPKNCWLPLEEMTVNNDRNYFRSHPEYHMFLHPDFPTYDQQIAARDNMLARHPGIRFVGVYAGSNRCWNGNRPDGSGRPQCRDHDYERGYGPGPNSKQQRCRPIRCAESEDRPLHG